jgi:CysZ protein
MKMHKKTPQPYSRIPLLSSIGFMLRRKRLLGWSLLLVLLTVAFTWVGYVFSIDLITGLTGDFFAHPPDSSTILGWIKYKGWLAGSWLFSVIARIVSFYLAFLLAYTITTPGYAFLSTAAEKLYAGELFDPDDNFSLGGFFIDIMEGIKIAFFGILVTIVALIVNFIPGIGQVAVFLLYTYYSALMFIDYPASRRRWPLGRKIGWLQNHSGPSLRIGLLPAVVSMIPIVNIFAMALLFPVLTIHATLNFAAIELHEKRSSLEITTAHLNQ